MYRPLHDYCRLGIVHSMAFPESVKNEAKFIATLQHILQDDFFEIVETGHMPFPSLRETVPQMIKTAHMDLTYCGHSLLFAADANINAIEEDERSRAVAVLKGGIDEANEFGALDFQFLSRRFDPNTIDKHLDALVCSTIELCEYAKQKGDMPVCLEIFDHDIDKRSLIGPSHLAKRYVEAVKEQVDNFGLMVDCSHIPMLHETIDASLDPIANHIIHAHMGNTIIADPTHRYYGDTHPGFGYPGSENDMEYLAEYLQKLLDVGYLDRCRRPVLSFEVKPQGDEDPLKVVANAKRTLRDAWRIVESKGDE